MKLNKKLLTIILAILFIGGILLSLYLYSVGFKIEDIIAYIGDNILVIILVSILIFSVRIFLFIPSTLIIIGLGILLNNFIFTFLISSIGIFIGLLQTYYIGYLLEEDLEGGRIIKKIKPHLIKVKENGFMYVFLGCLTPVLPSDLICYSAGFARYKLHKFLLAGMLGEIPLILIYSYLGGKAELFMKNINYIFILLLVIILVYFIFIKIIKKIII